MEQENLDTGIEQAVKTAAEAAVKNGKQELVIRTGEALPLHEEEKVTLTGTLESVRLFVKARKEHFDHAKAYIVIDRENASLTLRVDENNPKGTEVTGQLTVSPEIEKMGINNGEYCSTMDMAETIRHNRIYFGNKTLAMRLITELRNFKAKIDHEIELSDDKRGNTIAHRAQVVQSNIPQSFDVHMPIFKGGPETVIPVSIEIRPTDLACTLVSIEAEEHFKESRDKLIDEQVNAIRDEADDILIIEK